MKKLILTLALLMVANIAQADQFQTVMDAFDRYNRSLMTGTEYQPIQQVQQPQQYQVQPQQPQYVYYQVPQQTSYQPVQQQPVQYVQYQVPQQVQYVPVQQPQQYQTQQPAEQTNFNAKDAVQNVAGMANDVAYGIQTVKSIVNTFKGGF